jgi:hypothetical protein
VVSCFSFFLISCKVVAVEKPAKVPPTGNAPYKLVVTPVISALAAAPSTPAEEAMKCERCGADMYRMHAVWRCPSCRFKTDCCGW